MAVGNTALPIYLRLAIWACWRLTKRASFKFLLVNPRECCTHLFPATQTKILLVSWIILLFSQLLLFSLLNINMEVFRDCATNCTGWGRFLITLLEAINTR